MPIEASTSSGPKCPIIVVGPTSSHYQSGRQNDDREKTPNLTYRSPLRDIRGIPRQGILVVMGALGSCSDCIYALRASEKVYASSRNSRRRTSSRVQGVRGRLVRPVRCARDEDPILDVHAIHLREGPVDNTVARLTGVARGATTRLCD